MTGAELEALDALAAKSLVDPRRQPDDTTRLVMLETVRQYALARLADEPVGDTVRHRHLQHYLHLVQRTVPQLSTHNELEALRVLDRENDNITAAFQWARQNAPGDALCLAGYLSAYWQIRADQDRLSWLDAALEGAGDEAPAEYRARAQFGRAQALGVLNEHQPRSRCTPTCR